MGRHRSSTELWLQWTQQSKVDAKGEATAPQEHFSLAGPFRCLRAGSTEVVARYLCIRDNLLIMGPKWNVVDDFVELTGEQSARVGSVVCLSGGKDVAMRFFMNNDSQADEWVAMLSAASKELTTSSLVAKLQALVQRQKKVIRRQSLGAKFGAMVEALCCSGSVSSATRRLATQLGQPSPPTPEGAATAFQGRYKVKSSQGEGSGCLSFHGDCLLIQPLSVGSVVETSIVLRGMSPTVSKSLVSVRGQNGITVVRLWLNSEEEAEKCAASVREAAQASASLPKKQEVRTRPSTMRRQMGSAVTCVATSVVRAPCFAAAKLRQSLARCMMGGTTRRICDLEANGCNLDADDCRIFRDESSGVRSCHATLRGDVLWLGSKWNVGDEVLVLCNTKAVAVDDMVAIYADDDKVVARLWPAVGKNENARTWAEVLQVAGKLNSDGSWEARRRKERLDAEARRMARQLRFRRLAARLGGAAFTLCGMFWSKQKTGTEVLMQWQQASRLEAKPAPAPEADAKEGLAVRIFRRHLMAKPEHRILEVAGDVLFVSCEDGTPEHPLLLAGCTVYTNGNIVSIWHAGVMKARLFFDREAFAQSWAEPLQRACQLLAGVKSGRFEKALAPPRPGSHHKEMNRSSSTALRARRYSSPTKERRPKSGSQEDAESVPGAIMGG